MKRRDFLKNMGIMAAGLAIVPAIILKEGINRDAILSKLGFKKTKLQIGCSRICEIRSDYQGHEGNLTIAKYKPGCGQRQDCLPEKPWLAYYYKWGGYHGPRWTSWAVDEKSLLEAIAKWSV
jgi:hypothetical protein